MKKFFAIVMMVAALTANVSAQNNNNPQHKGNHRPEMNTEQVAQNVAKQLNLDEKATEKFVPLYKAYNDEKKDIREKYGKKKGNPQLMTDEDVAKANKDKFAQKRAMLDLEENYYKKFTKIMNDRQYNVLMKMGKKHHGNHMGKGRNHRGNRPMPQQFHGNHNDNHMPMMPQHGHHNAPVQEAK